MGESLEQLLQPIADWFASFGMPEPIIHWGHPLMMGIVVFVIGGVAGVSGWRARVFASGEDAKKARLKHRQAAPLLLLFISLGYTGGILSLVMQGQPILESPHFWTGSAAIVLLGLNGVISLTGFGGDKANLRKFHAYLGSTALILLFAHTLLGLKLGLSI